MEGVVTWEGEESSGWGRGHVGGLVVAQFRKGWSRGKGRSHVGGGGATWEGGGHVGGLVVAQFRAKVNIDKHV